MVNTLGWNRGNNMWAASFKNVSFDLDLALTKNVHEKIHGIHEKIHEIHANFHGMSMNPFRLPWDCERGHLEQILQHREVP